MRLFVLLCVVQAALSSGAWASYAPSAQGVRDGYKACYAPAAGAIEHAAQVDLLVVLDHNGLVELAKIIDYEPQTLVGRAHARAAIRAIHFCAPYLSRSTKVMMRIQAQQSSGQSAASN